MLLLMLMFFGVGVGVGRELERELELVEPSYGGAQRRQEQRQLSTDQQLLSREPWLPEEQFETSVPCLSRELLMKRKLISKKKRIGRKQEA